MRLNFDFQGILRTVKISENNQYDSLIKLYNDVRGYAARIFNSCEEDISLFLEGKPFILSNINYDELGKKLIKVRKNIESGLKGGKGGFGATIKSQKKKLNIKKLDIGDCRDLKTGRRIKDILKERENGKSVTFDENHKVEMLTERNENSNKNQSIDSLKYTNLRNGILKHYQTHILNLEDKWKNISNSIDFGFSHLDKNVIIGTNN
ncbi:hypothetical protein FG386_000649 [Cryptosporidium ryanae]|uniref:uncharacterized protein n=1 Tax=Cryptosporidium ryanae TaxID=515981 RepID=UPI00351A10F5|nr:hypothetical protein FG386_000649 [Cryptosporidium ryanae]